MEIVFNIELTCDLEHYVVQVKIGDNDEWQDITDPFDTQEEAVEWAKKIKDNYHVMMDLPF